MEESQAPTVLGDDFYDDPSQLSQAFRERASSDKPFHFTTSTESHNTGNHALSLSTFAFPQQSTAALLRLSVLLAPFNNAPSPRRAATTNYVKPALPKHNSAPTATGNITELEGALKMHHSFNGMDAPGDTQPDSQMLKGWTSGIYSTSEKEVSVPKPVPRSLFDHQEEDDGDDLPTDEMDIVASSQDHRIPTPTSPTAIDVDDNGEVAQDSMAPTSPLKFQTPALASRKRASSGQILSSAARTNATPGTVASASLFAFDNGGSGGAANLSLTQAFNNTQAPTSPVVGGVLEDVVFTRPSPNFTNMRHSSPIPAYSSPIKAICRDTPKSDPIVRSSSEPRAEYVTMKQSQDKRKHSIGDENSELMDQDSWQELSRMVKAQKAREQTHREAALSLSHISAPAPIPSRSGRKRTVNLEYPSPVQSRTSRSGVRDVPREDDDSADEHPQPLQVKENDNEDFADELLHSAPSTARTVEKDNSTANSVQVPKTSSHPRQTPSGQPSRNSSQQASPSSQLQRESQLQEPASQPLLRSAIRPHSSKESVAVMDSQPDATADFASIPPPKSLRFPSSPSINQYSINQTTMAIKTGYTSQVGSSSIPPLPPRSSPEEDIMPEEEERVPSSPPLIIPEDADGDEGGLQYDEHGYDEYGEEAGDREATEPLVVDEDTSMDEEDDLPVAKEESEDEATPEVQGVKSDEDGLDPVQPGKVDLGTDQEISEIYEQTQPENHMDEEAQLQRNETVGPPRPPRMQRQDTIPETDALDETQPSFFPDEVPQEPVNDDTAMAGDTNSTRLFQTAQEEQSESQSRKLAPPSSKETGSDTIQGGNRIRSIDDIYNLPETQQSTVEEEFEMPRLSGLDDDEEGPFMSRSSPAPPSAKRRKVTYTAKSKVFLSPPKETTDSEALSDPPPSPRIGKIQQPLEDTPPTASARKREDQGALAAARVREEVQAPYTRTTSLKSKVLPKPTRPQTQRKGALKPISRELLQSLSSPANSPARSKASVRSRASTPKTPTKSREVVIDQLADVDMLDAKDDIPGVDEEPELVSSVPPPTNVEMRLETPSQRTEISPEDIIVPNRVFASWPGSHYYPATCVGRATSRQLQIRYDDGNITSMDAIHVRALDLRIGDHVKVDETGLKKNTYVVVGFKDRIDDLAGEEFPTTDRRGHKTVVLEERPRESMTKERLLQQPEHISVPMVSIYLTTGLWKRLRDRSFNFSPPVSPVKAASRIGTPIADPFTTLSFTRRGTAAPSLLKSTTARAASVASTTRSGTGVFTNMAFVLTSTTADVDKEATTKAIKSNGGQVLEHGFHELFDQSESSDAPPSASQSRRRSVSAVEGSIGLALKHQYKDLGFVALISDSYSRSTKYIQALALNVPCLHLRWIQDSLAASRAALFTRYLLPAGVSKFLDPNGVVRSRTMAPYDPAGDDVSFSQTIQDRDLLFHDQSILLVTGKSKKEIEKRQPFVFLSHALGSANVGRCADLAAAAEMLADGKWDWVYVDNGERGVAEAVAELFGTEKPAASGKAKKGKKRKMDDSAEEKEELLVKGDVCGKQVKITCAEFVIQSLILGALVEE